MKPSTWVFAFLTFLYQACAQSSLPANPPLLVGSCEGCEAVFEFGDRQLSDTDTLPDFSLGDQQIRVSGKVFLPDGTTPAPDVILYIYHTTPEGIYENRYQAKDWSRRHGYLRGWIKTNQEGDYTFYTRMPGVYPNRSEPAHIHLTILEPDGRYYWLDSYLFSGDSLISNSVTNVPTRGGYPATIDLRMVDGLLAGERNIILGKNIPGYAGKH